MPLEAQKTLFHKFTQADESISRKHGGTGLGLAIAAETVKAMGGSMGFVSNQASCVGVCAEFFLVVFLLFFCSQT